MRKGKQELLERAEKDNNKQENLPSKVDQQDDFLQDEFDGEFWIKVTKMCRIGEKPFLNKNFQ